MDVTFFPYDIQTCEVELASWGFPSTAVNLSFLKTHVNLNNYRTNGEWDLLSTDQHHGEIIEDDLTYSELLFSLHVQRLPGYYLMSVIFPVIVTAVLTSVTFMLPVESGEKVGYILTVLLALAVLLTLFSDSLPTTSKHTSVLGKDCYHGYCNIIYLRSWVAEQFTLCSISKLQKLVFCVL